MPRPRRDMVAPCCDPMPRSSPCSSPSVVVLSGRSAPAQVVPDLPRRGRRRAGRRGRRGPGHLDRRHERRGDRASWVARGCPTSTSSWTRAPPPSTHAPSASMTVTLPNHTGMVTGRRIEAATGGHGVTWNDDRLTPAPCRSAAGHDVASVFTAVDDAGGSTALFAAKTKFRLWTAVVARRDRPRRRSRVQRARWSTQAIADIADRPRDFRFLHLSSPDVAGHAHGWMSRPYLDAVRQVDELVGQVRRQRHRRPGAAAGTTILLTSDHGGHGAGHDERPAWSTTTAWLHGAGRRGRRGGRPLRDQRGLPRPGRPAHDLRHARPPVRNGMVANLALDLLGLPPVAGSEFDVTQDLDARAADSHASGHGLKRHAAGALRLLHHRPAPGRHRAGSRRDRDPASGRSRG